MAISTINPTTGTELEVFDALDANEVEGRLALSAEAARSHRRTPVALRSRWLRSAADLLVAERDAIASIMTTEMGKTLSAARSEVDKSAQAMRFYAEQAAAFLADTPLADPAAVRATKATARFEPLGAILAVMPWNFPLWQVVRFAAPALAAGNVILLKHAANVPQSAMYLEGLFRRAGFPEGCFQSLLIEVDQVEAVLRDRRVAAVTVTGSETAGRAIAGIAGQEIKKTVLELGGSDPFVVMPSAQLDVAASVATTARCQNNGQSCIAAKRFIVHTAVYDEFARQFVSHMRGLRVGDPMLATTDIGPLATERGRREIVALVDDATRHGATVLCGGTTPTGPGWFYPPTVIADITPRMRLYHEEAFGPVAALYRVADLDAAIDLANATPFGLSSSAWTSNPAEQDRLATELEAGAVFLNGMSQSHPELPFGGIKRSGYGRELGAIGMHEFCNLKTIWAA